MFITMLPKWNFWNNPYIHPDGMGSQSIAWSGAVLLDGMQLLKDVWEKLITWENLYAILREKMRQKFVINIIVVENKYKVKNLLIENSKGNH